MRKTLGTAVFGGMLGVTLFGIFLTPVFFFAIDWLGESRLFHAVWMRRLGGIALEVFAFRGVRRLSVLVVQSVRRLQVNGVARNGQKHSGIQGDKGNGKPADDRIKKSSEQK